eukprot:7378791-Prymnesium_polylepis.1
MADQAAWLPRELHRIPCKLHEETVRHEANARLIRYLLLAPPNLVAHRRTRHDLTLFSDALAEGGGVHAARLQHRDLALLFRVELRQDVVQQVLGELCRLARSSRCGDHNNP